MLGLITLLLMWSKTFFTLEEVDILTTFKKQLPNKLIQLYIIMHFSSLAQNGQESIRASKFPKSYGNNAMGSGEEKSHGLVAT